MVSSLLALWLGLREDNSDDENIFAILKEDHTFFLQESHYNELPRYTSVEAVTVIQRNWRKYLHRNIYGHLKSVLYKLSKEDPIKILKRKDPIEAQLFEKSNGNVLVFRLAGDTFPPVVVYKVFTTRCIINIFDESRRPNHTSEHRRKGRTKTCWGWRMVYEYRKTGKDCTNSVAQYKSALYETHQNKRRRKRSRINWIREMYDVEAV